MRYSVPISRNTRTTWRTDVREIAEALGIPIRPNQWVVLESGEADEELPLARTVDVVVWQSQQPAEYVGPEFMAGGKAGE